MERGLRLICHADCGRRAGVRLLGGASDLHPRGAAQPAEREHLEPVLGLPGDRGRAARGGSGVRVAQRTAARRTTTSAIPRSGPTHCDVVVEMQPGRIRVIGGNVSQTVGEKWLRTLTDGRLSLVGAQSPFFAVIRCRPGAAIGADPGARARRRGRGRPGAAGDGSPCEPVWLPRKRRRGHGGQPDRRVAVHAQPDRGQPLGDADAGARLHRPRCGTSRRTRSATGATAGAPGRAFPASGIAQWTSPTAGRVVPARLPRTAAGLGDPVGPRRAGGLPGGRAARRVSPGRRHAEVARRDLEQASDAVLLHFERPASVLNRPPTDPAVQSVHQPPPRARRPRAPDLPSTSTPR